MSLFVVAILVLNITTRPFPIEGSKVLYNDVSVSDYNTPR